MTTSASRQPAGTSLRARISLVVFGCVLGLLACELLLHVLPVEPQPLRTKRWLIYEDGKRLYYHCYPSNPQGTFQPAPETQPGPWSLQTMPYYPRELSLEQLGETPWCIEYRLSAQGLRDRGYSTTPAEGVTRILAAGDSFLMGEGVPQEQMLTRQLETALDIPCEVVNLGEPGFYLDQSVARLRIAMKRFQASRALVLWVPNDIRLPASLSRRQQYINDLILFRDDRFAEHQRRAWYHGKLRLLELVGSVIEQRRISHATIQWYLDSYDPQLNPQGLEEIRGLLRELATMPGCRVALVLYPLMEQLESGYPLMPIHETVARMAAEAGLPTLDLAPSFRGLDTRELQVHPADHHPNARAHAIAARAVSDWLRTELPELLEASQ